MVVVVNVAVVVVVMMVMVVVIVVFETSSVAQAGQSWPHRPSWAPRQRAAPPWTHSLQLEQMEILKSLAFSRNWFGSHLLRYGRPPNSKCWLLDLQWVITHWLLQYIMAFFLENISLHESTHLECNRRTEAPTKALNKTRWACNIVCNMFGQKLLIMSS